MTDVTAEVLAAQRRCMTHGWQCWVRFYPPSPSSPRTWRCRVCQRARMMTRRVGYRRAA